MLRGLFLEEIAHVELVQNTINQLLDGAGLSEPGNIGEDQALLDEAVKHANPHHFIVGAKSSLLSTLAAILGTVRGCTHMAIKLLTY
ncbi:hypothetical protein PCURB6_44360 [Paenibacillus curdlanolyticus]|nr:hypothetical protein PCURB6_44360 [Paenibacillus curdlanolyticus]